MQATQINLFAKTIEEVEQEEFISILHHDANKRGGMFTRFDIRKNAYDRTEIHEKWASKNAYRLMTQDAAYNRYIALNSFHNIKETVLEEVDGRLVEKEVKTLRRKETHLHALTSVYLDLDWHEGTKEDIEKRVNNTKALLESSYQNQKLPRPTMITKTGRGLGIFYVLDSSIANSCRAGKQIRFWEYICREYAKKYQDILGASEKEQLEVDPKVIGDTTRVVRLPGTKNLNTNSLCRLISVYKKEDGSPVYYSLNELIQYVESYNVYEKTYKEVKSKIAQNKIVNFNAYNNPFLLQRLEKLKRAQELVIDQKEGSRELLCFVYYNTAKQLMSDKEAYEEMLKFNQMFRYPITDKKELQNITSAVAGATDMDKKSQGFYKYKDVTLKALLNIKDEDNDYVGFGTSQKDMLRRKRKEETRKKKQERNDAIVSYVVEHPEVTYEDIAGLFKVSLRTIKNILKEADVHRYQKQESETFICAAANVELANGVEETNDKVIQFAAPKREKYNSRIESKTVRLPKVQNFALVSRKCCPESMRMSISNNNFEQNESKIPSKATCNQGALLDVMRNVLEKEDGWHLLSDQQLVDVPFPDESSG